MKKILNIIILFAAVVFCGCSDFDDSELRGRIDGYKNRIEALKAKAETLGKQLADLSYLTNGNVITTVSQDADGKYVVTYKDNKDVEHTVVLATMDDIVDVPIIGVKLDENGVYYWTKCIDGEITWLTDDDGEKFPVSGYTPDDFGRCRRLLDRGRRADTRRFGQPDQGHDRRHVGIPLGGAGRRRQFQPDARRRKHDHPAGFQLAQPQAGRDAGYHRRRPFEEHYGILRAFGRG